VPGFGSSEFDFPIAPRVSRRTFLGASMMLPLAGVAQSRFAFAAEQEAAANGIGSEPPDEGSYPEYPGALVGIWCAASEAKLAGARRTWNLEIPLGWLETTVTLAYESKALVPNSVEVLLDGKSAGRLSTLLTLLTHEKNAPAAGWLALKYVSKGPHEF
jgi:hypothetical protein